MWPSTTGVRGRASRPDRSSTNAALVDDSGPPILSDAVLMRLGRERQGAASPSSGCLAHDSARRHGPTGLLRITYVVYQDKSIASIFDKTRSCRCRGLSDGPAGRCLFPLWCVVYHESYGPCLARSRKRRGGFFLQSALLALAASPAPRLARFVRAKRAPRPIYRARRQGPTVEMVPVVPRHGVL